MILDLRHAREPTAISIVWNPPTIFNGIITVYEIRYRESTSTGPYNITNTTNTQYSNVSIVGLIPNTSYTIGVRAYTSIGPGEWTDRKYTTAQIRKELKYCPNFRYFLNFSCHSNLLCYKAQFYSNEG